MPKLPIVMSLIPMTVEGNPYGVNEALRQASVENFYNRHVETDGFEIKEDNLHYTSAGLIDLGEAFADAVKRL